MKSEDCKEKISQVYGGKSSDWKRIQKIDYKNGIVRVFENKLSGKIITIINGDEVNLFEKKFTVLCNIPYLIERLKKAADKIKHCGDYGYIFLNLFSNSVVWVAGDADDADEESGMTSFEDIEKIFKDEGIKNVEIECENSPKESEGYIFLGNFGEEVESLY